jgi:hypothetical protein
MFICQSGMHNNVQGHRNANVCKQTYETCCRARSKSDAQKTAVHEPHNIVDDVTPGGSRCLGEIHIVVSPVRAPRIAQIQHTCAPLLSTQSACMHFHQHIKA